MMTTKMTKKTRNTKSLTCCALALVLSAIGCGDSSPAAPVDNIEKNIKTQQDMKTDLNDIAKKKKEGTDAANPLNKKK